MVAESIVTKLAYNLPWIVRYPFWRAEELIRRFTEKVEIAHLILVVANHFEPGYNEEPNQQGGYGVIMDWSTQQRRLDAYCKLAAATGNRVRDHDGTPFRHTNFYPAEQYNAPLLDRLAALQADGFGEVEIHLHHGVERPDTVANLRRELVTFRDLLAEEHRCLSREPGKNGTAKYAFVHGNWALGNSARGAWCGVDSEVEILAETGCYADLSLPSAPHISQVPRINAIYQCGHPLDESMPHRSGPNLRVGEPAREPVIFTGPLVLDWDKRKFGLFPRLDNSALTAGYPLSPARLERLRKARINVLGRPEWVFIKLYCHGFFDDDQAAVIGAPMADFLEQCLELSERTGRFKLHFATAREAFNMISAAAEGHEGEPGLYRDHKLQQIMEMSGNLRAQGEPAVLEDDESLGGSLPYSIHGSDRIATISDTLETGGARILYLTDLCPTDKFGSMEEQIFILAQSINRRGGLFLPVFRSPLAAQVVEQYRREGLRVEELNLHQLSLTTLLSLLRLVRENEIGIVHWNFYSPINPYVWWLTILAPGLTHYLTDHTSRVLPLEDAPRGLKRRFKQLLFKRYRKVLCISDFVVECLNQQRTWSNISRCTYFINTDRFEPRSDVRAALRNEFQAEGKFVMLFVAHLIPAKGGDVVTRALAALPESVELWVVGDGVDRGRLEALCEELAVAKRVRFLGNQRNVEPFMQAADCFVCPSLWGEATGLVNLEALACGLPVIGSRIGGIPEFVDDGRTGLLFEPGKHDELAEKVRRLVAEPELLKRLSNQARLDAVEKYSIARRIPEYVEAYRD